MNRRLLLLSNSTQHGYEYLQHAASEIRDFLGDAVARVLFVPFAIGDWDGYAQQARETFEDFGYDLDSLHEAAADEQGAAVHAADALFIGGAELDNNFRLAAQNIPNVDVLPVQGINVYDILRRGKLVLSKAAVEALEERFK